MRKSWLVLTIMTLLLRSNGALALVDISGKDKVEVGSWSELKAAVADSGNAGKVIVLTGNITADVNNPIDMVGGAGIIIDGGGHTITGQEGSKDGQFINFDENDTTDLIVQNVNFEGFVHSGSNNVNGGVIYNGGGTLGNIAGDFSGNYVKGGRNAQGGAIYNKGTISDITGDFTENYALAGSYGDYRGTGGAIYNSGTIGDINGTFKKNYASGGRGDGGAIYNGYGSPYIHNITGYFEENHTKSSGGAIYNGGVIDNINANFNKNYVYNSGESYSYGARYSSYGGVIYNNGTIGTITGDFTNNYTKSDISSYDEYKQYSVANGGAIYNRGKINKIDGDFVRNYALGYSSYGGAIYNHNYASIGEITGDFTENYALGENYAYGGAIYTGSPLTLVNSSFYNNYAQSDGIDAEGGAIFSIGDLTLKADAGESIFSGNKIKWGNMEDSSAIFIVNEDPTHPTTLTLNSQNHGIIQFDDKIKTISAQYTELKAYLKNYISEGFRVNCDGNGGYNIVTGTGNVNHIEAHNNSHLLFQYQTSVDIPAAEFQEILAQAEAMGAEVVQEGDKYIISMYEEGEAARFEVNPSENGYSAKLYEGIVLTQEQLEMALQEAESKGWKIEDDGNGGYNLIDVIKTIYNVEKKDNAFYIPQGEENKISQEVKDFIAEKENAGAVINQDGENYKIVANVDGKTICYEIVKQEDGSYVLRTFVVLLPSHSDNIIAITGDSSSRVVFNNAIENVAKIDISGTNVDANEGVGTIFRTITHDGGVLNINAGAKAEDSIINQGGTMNVANSAKAYRTEVNNGGVLNVASGGYVQDTTVNTGGKLTAAAQATINNMLANDGAILDIDRDAYLTGNIIIHAAATMGGSYDYSKIFKDEITDKGSLTLVGGLNNILNESSLVNTTSNKKLNLTAGDYAIGDGAQAVQGWDVLSFKNNANVKLEGDIAMSDAKKKLYIENGSTLDLAGHSPSNYTITGSLVNDGLVTFSHVDDEADDTTTVYGNYLAYNNAQMTIDVNPQTNTSDLMIVDGDVQGTTLVNLNVLNEAKPSEKILFVEALNDNPATGAAFYTQDGHIFGSPYKWNVLYENNRWYVGTDDVIPDGATNGYGDSDLGEITDDTVLEEDAVLPPSFPDVPSSSTGDAGNGNTSVVFRKPSVVGEVIAYMGLPSAGIEQTRDMTRNVSSKVASTKIYSQQCHGYYDCEYNGQGLRNAWASPVYSYSEVKSPYKYDAEIAGLDAGLDLQADEHNRLGVYVSSRYGNYDFDGKGDDYYSKTGSEIDIDSYILGFYYRYDGGKYWAMSQVFGGYQDVDIASDDGFGSSTDGIVFGGSIESGLTFTPRKDVVIEPTMRVGYTQINYDKLKDNYGKTADFDDVRNIELEAGVKIEKAFARDRGFGKVYIKPSVIQNIGSGDVKVTGLQTVEGLEDATLGRVEIGGSMSFNESWSAYLFAAYTFGSDYKNASINAGLNYAF